LPHGFGADGIHQAQDHHLVGQQLQSPVAPAPWRFAASQGNQLLFDVSFDLDLVRPRRLRLVVDGCLEAFGDETLPNTLDGPQTGSQSRHDLVIGAAIAVGLQKDASMGQLSSRCFSGGNEPFQFRPLLHRKVDTILVHCGTSVS
jgi:hypothetical protein